MVPDTALKYLFKNLSYSDTANCILSILKEKTSKQTGRITYQEFYPRLSKNVIDKIDEVLAEYFNFTEEELLYITSYDIKYRLGAESEDEE